jgi:hypothetical protein
MAPERPGGMVTLALWPADLGRADA